MTEKTQDARRKAQDPASLFASPWQASREPRATSPGFSLGMLFIAGVFPVSIHFTTIASERTIAAIVADEAFAKIKLYGVNLSDSDLSYVSQANYEDVNLLPVPASEFAYPSIPTTDPALRKYWWSAICRRVSTDELQVTVFISRKAGTATVYPNLVDTGRPVAVLLSVTTGSKNDELSVTGNKGYVGDGCIVVDDGTGQIYRVLEKYKSPNDNVIRLDKDWQGIPSAIWVIPPPVAGTPPVPNGRYPCIAVYQKVMSF